MYENPVYVYISLDLFDNKLNVINVSNVGNSAV